MAHERRNAGARASQSAPRGARTEASGVRGAGQRTRSALWTPGWSHMRSPICVVPFAPRQAAVSAEAGTRGAGDAPPTPRRFRRAATAPLGPPQARPHAAWAPSCLRQPGFPAVFSARRTRQRGSGSELPWKPKCALFAEPQNMDRVSSLLTREMDFKSILQANDMCAGPLVGAVRVPADPCHV